MHEPPRETIDAEALATVERFTACCQFGRMDKASALLAPDVLFVTDGGRFYCGPRRWELEQRAAKVEGRVFDVISHRGNGCRVTAIGTYTDRDRVARGQAPLACAVEYIVRDGSIAVVIEYRDRRAGEARAAPPDDSRISLGA